MTYQFFLYKVDSGSIKCFSFNDSRLSIDEQINIARKKIAEKYGITTADVQPMDFAYGGGGEFINIQ